MCLSNKKEINLSSYFIARLRAKNYLEGVKAGRAKFKRERFYKFKDDFLKSYEFAKSYLNKNSEKSRINLMSDFLRIEEKFKFHKEAKIEQKPKRNKNIKKFFVKSGELPKNFYEDDIEAINDF